MKEKFVRKYIRLAKHIGEDQNPCYSRKIGAVITTGDGRRILGTGYNGPPPGTPHCDSSDFLEHFWWPQLTDTEKESFKLQFGQVDTCQSVVKAYTDCGTCPRKLVGAKSGERSELCSCGHAERHAITNAACDLQGACMFIWSDCGICLPCADAIIQAHISNVHMILTPAYHERTEWLLIEGGVKIHTWNLETILWDLKYS